MNEITTHLFWVLVKDLDVPYAVATEFVSRHGMRSAIEACAPGALHVPNAEKLAKKLPQKRPMLYVIQKMMDNWTWMKENQITHYDLRNVTYSEWGVFETTNAGVMVAHGVKVPAVWPLLKDEVAKRYAIALSICPRDVSVSVVREEFGQYGLDWSTDFLDFDPSAGALADHELEDAETLCDAMKRKPKVTYGEYAHFCRMHNALVMHEGAIWLRAALDGRLKTPEILADMIRAGATEEEKQSWVVTLFEG